jgi:hypothetical protein
MASKTPKPLGLRIQRKWLQAIVSGKKKIEYRDFSDHYIPRFGILGGDGVLCRDDIKALRLYVSSKEYAIVELKRIDFGGKETEGESTPFHLHLGKVLLDKSGDRLEPSPKAHKTRLR